MSAATGIPRAAAVYLGVVQFLFATTWTLYVIYLPRLAEQAGIGREWIAGILIADQVIIAIMDVITGFWADRVRAGLARLGGWILALSAVSCLAFVAMPFAGASAATLTLLILLWALTSSALRAPPWALLSRYAATPSIPWLSTLVLTGTAAAAALAPYLGVVLRDVDPRMPFLVSTATLLACVGGLVVVERHLAAAAPAPAAEREAPFDLSGAQAKREVTVFFTALLLMAASFQVHFSLNSAELFLFFAAEEELQYLMPVFWIGFNLMMFPAAGFVKRFGAFPVMAAGSAVGSGATLAAMLAPGLDGLVAAQVIAGGCWGAVNVGAFSAAIGFGRSSREGAFLGTLFATLAIAAFIRIGAYTGDIESDAAIGKLLAWGPVGGWLLGALLLGATLAAARRRAA